MSNNILSISSSLQSSKNAAPELHIDAEQTATIVNANCGITDSSKKISAEDLKNIESDKREITITLILNGKETTATGKPIALLIDLMTKSDNDDFFALNQNEFVKGIREICSKVTELPATVTTNDEFAYTAAQKILSKLPSQTINNSVQLIDDRNNKQSDKASLKLSLVKTGWTPSEDPKQPENTYDAKFYDTQTKICLNIKPVEIAAGREVLSGKKTEDATIAIPEKSTTNRSSNEISVADTFIENLLISNK